MKTLLMAALVLGPVFGVFGTTHAAAQSDPYAGLPAGVRTVGAALDAGDSARILALLHPDTVTRTAFPGDGENVPTAVARAEIPSRIIGSSASDELGPGRFRVIAVWRPSATDEILLMASGIAPNGRRETTAFGVTATGETAQITAWGIVIDAATTLAQWKAQGDLRMVEASAAPAPPSTGTGPRQDDGAPLWAALFVAAVVGAGAVATARGARRS